MEEAEEAEEVEKEKEEEKEAAEEDCTCTAAGHRPGRFGGRQGAETGRKREEIWGPSGAEVTGGRREEIGQRVNTSGKVAKRAFYISNKILFSILFHLKNS